MEGNVPAAPCDLSVSALERMTVHPSKATRWRSWATEAAINEADPVDDGRAHGPVGTPDHPSRGERLGAEMPGWLPTAQRRLSAVHARGGWLPSHHFTPSTAAVNDCPVW
jgi:hypothetical protein